MNNLENKIKKEFKLREITPSISAWNELDKKLNKETKKTNKKYILYKVAVVLTGLLISLNVFFNRTSDSKIEKNIEIESFNNLLNDDNIVLTNVKSKTNKIEIVNLANKPLLNIKKIKSTTVTKNVTPNSYKKQTPNTKPNQLAINYQKKSIKITQTTYHNTNKNKQIIAPQTISITKKVQKKKIIKTKVLMNSSDDDINNMLSMSLEKEKTTYQLRIKNENLIYAVENQLNKESKKRIFRIIKTGVDTVKNVIVVNNN